MKRLILLIMVAAALVLSLGYEGNAEAESYGRWQFHLVADSVPAQTADTFYVVTKYADAFQFIGIWQGAMTGATNGQLMAQIPVSENTVGATVFWQTMRMQKADAASATNIAPGNVNIFFTVGAGQFSDGDFGILTHFLPGDTLRLTYAKATVTGGVISIYGWTRPILAD